MNSSASLQLPKLSYLPVLRHPFRSRSARPSASRQITAMAEATRCTQKDAIEKIKAELIPHIHETKCHPILIRLAWHDAGSYDKVRPTCGVPPSISKGIQC